MVWENVQVWPTGSTAVYCRSPYGWSAGSVRIVAPAARACAQCASASSTRTITVAGATGPAASTSEPDPYDSWTRWVPMARRSRNPKAARSHALSATTSGQFSTGITAEGGIDRLSSIGTS